MTADTRQADHPANSTPSLTRLVELLVVGTGIALLLVISAYLVALELADPLVLGEAGEVTLAQATGFTILGAIAGAAIAVAIERFSRRPRLTFLAATSIAVTGYAVVPLGAAESLVTAVWLGLFHLVAAVPVVGMLARWLPGDRTPPGE